MVSAWIEHIKDFAKRHNITYSCALSTPLCSQEYQQKKGKGSPRLSAYSDLQTMVSKAQLMPKKVKPTIVQPIKSLPPLISDREEELYTFKIVKLKDILAGYRIKVVSKMKKEDMVKAILSHENIKEGVRMGDYPYIYADLKKAHGCLMNDEGGLKQALFALEQSKEKIEAGKGKMTSDNYILLRNNIERYKRRIAECESLINRDYVKEYEDEKDRIKAQQMPIKVMPQVKAYSDLQAMVSKAQQMPIKVKPTIQIKAYKVKDEHNIIEELDNETTFPILVYQQPEYKPLIENIERLILKKGYIIPSHLLSDKASKTLLNNMFEYWSKKVGVLQAIEKIDEGIRNIIVYMGGEEQLSPDKDISGYMRNLLTKNKHILHKALSK